MSACQKLESLNLFCVFVLLLYFVAAEAERTARDGEGNERNCLNNQNTFQSVMLVRSMLF